MGSHSSFTPVYLSSSSVISPKFSAMSFFSMEGCFSYSLPTSMFSPMSTGATRSQSLEKAKLILMQTGLSSKIRRRCPSAKSVVTIVKFILCNSFKNAHWQSQPPCHCQNVYRNCCTFLVLNVITEKHEDRLPLVM